jgi:hypothetical protein
LHRLANRTSGRTATSTASRTTGWLILGTLLLVALLPIRLFEEANPDWRRLLWLHALAVTSFGLCLTTYVCGWSWTRHFLFSLTFILVAVPWPYQIELRLVQGLMSGIASVVVELGGFFGIPAIRHGNVIKVAAGMVGIDEAAMADRFDSIVSGNRGASIGRRVGAGIVGE